MPQMDVSIVMPVLNGAASIGPQLDALYAQRTERSWEFVLADNGCTDETVELASRHPISARMKVVNASRRTSVYSGASRPPIPRQAGHPFQANPATDST